MKRTSSASVDQRGQFQVLQSDASNSVRPDQGVAEIPLTAARRHYGSHTDWPHSGSKPSAHWLRCPIRAHIGAAERPPYWMASPKNIESCRHILIIDLLLLEVITDAALVERFHRSRHEITQGVFFS